LFIIFITEVVGLGALRWLLEGKYLQREKESGEGGGFGCWLLILFFLAGLVVYNFHHRGISLGLFEVADKEAKRSFGADNF